MKIINFKYKNNNQAGFSMVMVISALAVVAAGTAYIIDINKNNKVVAAKARSTSFAETERRRVSGILSNSDTCKMAANFGGAAAIRGDIASLVASNGSTLIQKNTTYFGGVLKLSNISTIKKAASDAKGYELVLDYSDVNNIVKSSFVGKNRTQIRIPMYMKVSGAVVVDCYSLSETSELDVAIENSCSPGIASAVRTNVLNKTAEGNVAQCQQNVITDTNYSTNYSTNPYTTCKVNTPDYRFMSGVGISISPGPTDTGGSLQFQFSSHCGNVFGVGATSVKDCGGGSKRTHKMASHTNSCEDPGAVRDFDAGSALCAAGNLLFHNTSLTTTCVAIDCSPANQFFQKISTAGVPSCYLVKTKNCPAGQYISGFDGTGTPSCADLPVISGTCGGQYGTAVSRTTAYGTNGNLTCSTGVVVAKSCPAGPTTFAYELTPTGRNCTTY